MNLGTRVLGPVEFLVGVPRAFECFDPPPSGLVLGEWSARLGQDLFYPPNVGGWPGGRSWVTTRAVIGRANYAAAVAGGRDVGRPEPLDALAFARRHGRGSGVDGVVTFYAELLRGAAPSAAERVRLLAALRAAPADEATTARRAVALLLAAPEGQLA